VCGVHRSVGSITIEPLRPFLSKSYGSPLNFQSLSNPFEAQEEISSQTGEPLSVYSHLATGLSRCSFVQAHSVFLGCRICFAARAQEPRTSEGFRDLPACDADATSSERLSSEYLSAVSLLFAHRLASAVLATRDLATAAPASSIAAPSPAGPRRFPDCL